MSALVNEFRHLGRTNVYTIVMEKLGCYKLCAKVITDTAHRPAQIIMNADEWFWIATDKREMICFPTMLRVTSRGYPTSIQKQNNSQCSADTRLHQTQWGNSRFSLGTFEASTVVQSRPSNYRLHSLILLLLKLARRTKI